MNEQNSNRKAVNHGEVMVPVPEAKSPPFIPMFLRQVGVVTLGLSHEESVEQYTLCDLIAVTSCRVNGHEIAPGDTFKLPGNQAIFLVQDGHCVFADSERGKEEERVLEAARKLSLPE